MKSGMTSIGTARYTAEQAEAQAYPAGQRTVGGQAGDQPQEVGKQAYRLRTPPRGLATSSVTTSASQTNRMPASTPRAIRSVPLTRSG